MLTTILRSVIRQARRHPLYVGLNVFGLALGIGVFLTLALLVRFEYSYNASLPDVDRLVRVDEYFTLPGNAPRESPGVTFRAVPFLREDFPEIEDASRVEAETLQVERNGSFTAFDAYLTDPSLFRLFGVTMLHGSPSDALSRPDGLVLSQKAAQTLFGTTEVLGRTVEINRNGTRSAHVVTGVLAARADPDFFSRIEIFVPLPAEDMRPFLTRSLIFRNYLPTARIS
ncbi:ABC transporter permease [Acidomonas methanolica]|uniref:MacB-like periplasmic core domain-containing protein n=1 Tax=Acidomonas methanolica NBRC 104435 TaxID=1231351 RepID=A0A023D2U9_ACIMT|nr:ABC transporter permease [Acidomonas methanolica]TCS21558.1 MacB-like protein [Acidomonas methanolica]GAJ28399.1 hypothetical protein Amme_021_014 [Acidomonas methanolica NBRC 104435]GBQ49423.1 hypothetical protein AA0498_0977 [Acidomonas methanolica]GEL00383.1 hypothetical protein AME01nite_28810 [Acidomonas methanolica NBRC 104435]